MLTPMTHSAKVFAKVRKKEKMCKKASGDFAIAGRRFRVNHVFSREGMGSAGAYL